MDSSFTYTCINPVFGEGLHGFQVLQQITPFRQSKIQVPTVIVLLTDLN